ncbi:hypothetical protein DN069_24025 [Streptacidiphilus pinicola]|uniref:Trypsin-co-occurring domain-containing protein n=1 Tax=Streptacidiphilus pinicola TaxID=2219663 RepID=A0A2X0J6Q2_9ACTN|nr:trypco2 family protein [Streptacidiphilus pinicola]RAG83108.1 hypothetical protein DN069_24025 [Streptacidiphilus pinicola]
MDTGLPVDDLIAVIKRAIKYANISETDASRDLRVTSVHLHLNTVATASSGGGVDFRIPFVGMQLRIGGKVTHKDTHSIELTLVPEDLAEHEVRDGRVEEVLVDAIGTLRRLVAGAATGDDPFVLKDSTVELVFAVEEDGTIALGFEGELKNEVTHTLRLGLGVPH